MQAPCEKHQEISPLYEREIFRSMSIYQRKPEWTVRDSRVPPKTVQESFMRSLVAQIVVKLEVSDGPKQPISPYEVYEERARRGSSASG